MGKRSRKRKAKEPRPGSFRYPPNARSFELKLARAQHHLQNVQQQIGGWVQACLDTLREEPDPKEAGYYCAWVDAPELDFQLLSLRVGDCLQCLRSALDHLALELATAFTVPLTDEVEKNSAFPILSDVDKNGNFGIGPQKWNSALASEVKGMDPGAQTAIERLQPYQRGQAYETDPLWQLGTLNNVDKHRLLHIVRWVMSGATMPVGGPKLPKSQWPRNVAGLGLPTGEMSVMEIAGEIAAEGRTRVARWAMWPIDPNKKMHMGFSPVLNVVFDAGTPLVGNLPVLDVLTATSNYILSDVLPPLVGYLK